MMVFNLTELALLPKSHKEAFVAGSKIYFSSEPCKHNHISPRYTSGKSCVLCTKERSKTLKYIERIKQMGKFYTRKYRQKPGVKEREKETAKKRRQTPEFRTKTKIYNQLPDVKKKRVKNTIRYQKNRRKIDISFRIKDNISKYFRHAFNGDESKTTKDILHSLNYTIADLKNYLEDLFLPEMSWLNYGKGRDKWNIDHVIPICSFNYDSYLHPEFKKCWALSNLRPLWEQDNLKKAKEDRKLSIRSKKNEKI